MEERVELQVLKIEYVLLSPKKPPGEWEDREERFKAAKNSRTIRYRSFCRLAAQANAGGL